MSKYNCKINPKENYEYQTIDLNWAKKPIAFCHYYKGYLTEKQIKIHKCEYKKYGFCYQLEPLIDNKYFKFLIDTIFVWLLFLHHYQILLVSLHL